LTFDVEKLYGGDQMNQAVWSCLHGFTSK
jgi:hypothetical protein